jgi:hypothetical protein
MLSGNSKLSLSLWVLRLRHADKLLTNDINIPSRIREVFGPGIRHLFGLSVD